MLGTWFHRLQVPTSWTWESRWSKVKPWSRIYFTITYTWLHKHTLHMGCPELLHKSTFLPVIYISSCWQQSPISNFIGKAGLYHWPWYMALLVVTKPHSYPWHHCFHRNNITTFCKGEKLQGDSQRQQNPNNATRICMLLVKVVF